MTSPDFHQDVPIEQVAARWAVRTSGGDLSGVQRADLEAWLAADRRHRGAFLRARAGLRLMERALVNEPCQHLSDNDNDCKSWRGMSGLWGRLATGAMLAATGAAVFLMMGRSVNPPADPKMTVSVADAGRHMKLDDGSTVTLARDGRIDVAMSGETRRIVLLAGEATFKVAKDPARPFVVQSGSVYAQATGTVYSVRREGEGGGAVAVTEGSVLVWARDEREQAVLLHAGDRLTLEPRPRSPVTPEASHALPPPAIAKISLDNVTIKSAVERFNRVNSTQITVADPRIGAVRIVGLFRANDPERFAQTVAKFTDAKVVHEGRDIVIKMK